jgi:hypothetical protein
MRSRAPARASTRWHPSSLPAPAVRQASRVKEPVIILHITGTTVLIQYSSYLITVRVFVMIRKGDGNAGVSCCDSDTGNMTSTTSSPDGRVMSMPVRRHVSIAQPILAPSGPSSPTVPLSHGFRCSLHVVLPRWGQRLAIRLGTSMWQGSLSRGKACLHKRTEQTVNARH